MQATQPSGAGYDSIPADPSISLEERLARAAERQAIALEAIQNLLEPVSRKARLSLEVRRREMRNTSRRIEGGDTDLEELKTDFARALAIANEI